jgi:hypothetical protein
MLERSRATLAEERARCEAVLMQLANFEAEKAKMQQEINGWALPFFACLFFVLYVCELLFPYAALGPARLFRIVVQVCVRKSQAWRFTPKIWQTKFHLLN